MSYLLRFAIALAAFAPPDHRWAPSSTTAISITGTVTLAAHQLKIANKTFPLTLAQQIDKAHLADVGKIVDASEQPSSASLFKTLIPKRAALLHSNTICGAEDATWMLAVFGKDSLSLAFFSGANQPNLDPKIVANSTSLCGTYAYASSSQ